jgi:hypothetical protein
MKKIVHLNVIVVLIKVMLSRCRHISMVLAAIMIVIDHNYRKGYHK